MYICKVCGYDRKDEPKEYWEICPNCDNRAWMKEGERNDLQWTTEPPKEPGWYWAVHEGAPNEVFITEVIELDNNYLTTDRSPIYQYTHWLGPLPVPVPPKGMIE